MYFTGEGDKLRDLSVARSCIRLLPVFMCILVMTILAGVWQLLIVTIYPQQSSVRKKSLIDFRCCWGFCHIR